MSKEFESRLLGFDLEEESWFAHVRECAGPPALGLIGPFELLAEAGRGGQGVVYKARQPRTGRVIAVKRLLAGSLATRDAQIRFEREIQAAAALQHPAIVTVFGTEIVDGQAVLAMEWVDGVPFDRWAERPLPDGRGSDDGESGGLSHGCGTGLKPVPAPVENRCHTKHRKQDPRPPRDVLAVFQKVCEAVHHAHQRGVIHRDLKPGNILVDADDNPHVLDFGLARLFSPYGSDSLVQANTTGFVGTPAFAAPEQLGAEDATVDVRSDVFSLGCTLYQALTGVSAHGGGSSFVDVFKAIEQFEARRPSFFRPELDRDIDAMVLKALAKEKSRRYQSVEALGEDVRRYLANEPIAAKGRSGLYVLRKYIRRNRAMLSIVATTTLVFLGAIIAFVWSRRAADERKRVAEQDALLSDAETRIHQTEAHRSDFRELEYELRGFQSQRTAEYFPPEKDLEMLRVESEVESAIVQREENFYTVLELLRRAEAIGAASEQVRHLRGELFLQEFFDELNHGNTIRADELRRQVLANDPTGELEKRIAGKREVRFSESLHGAEYYLFEMVEQAQLAAGGEHRLVPIPVGNPTLPVPPGTWVLRVATGAGPLVPGDLILTVAGHPVQGTILVTKGAGTIQRFDRLVSIDGHAVLSRYEVRRLGSPDSGDWNKPFEFERRGERSMVLGRSLNELGIEVADLAEITKRGDVNADVWHEGRVQTMHLPPGLDVRVTSRPLFVFPEAKRVVASQTPVGVRPGHYFMLLRKPGHEDVRIEWQHDDTWNIPPIRIPSRSSAPPGFQFISFRRDFLPGFWIQEHEVTAGQYLEFVNDPETLMRIAQSSKPVLFPRSDQNAAAGGHWVRAADGCFELPARWDPDWPVFGVSWHDAVAYAEWRTLQAHRAGLNQPFALPTLTEWESACIHSVGEQKYVFGFRFHPKWMSSCYARSVPGIEPVMSFPIDESAFGVYDTAGSVSEWLDDWWLEDRGLRRHAGGSWADGGPADLFGVSGGNGLGPDRVSATVGFRLVLRLPPSES